MGADDGSGDNKAEEVRDSDFIEQNGGCEDNNKDKEEFEDGVFEG